MVPLFHYPPTPRPYGNHPSMYDHAIPPSIFDHSLHRISLRDRQFCSPKDMAKTKAVAASGYGKATNVKTRLATHAEVSTTALPPCSSVADSLRLRRWRTRRRDLLLMRRYLLPRCFLARALLIVSGYGGGGRGGQTCYSCGGIYYRAASLFERC